VEFVCKQRQSALQLMKTAAGRYFLACFSAELGLESTAEKFENIIRSVALLAVTVFSIYSAAFVLSDKSGAKLATASRSSNREGYTLYKLTN
jgi:hypothetical protein